MSSGTSTFKSGDVVDYLYDRISELPIKPYVDGRDYRAVRDRNRTEKPRVHDTILLDDVFRILGELREEMETGDVAS